MRPLSTARHDICIFVHGALRSLLLLLPTSNTSLRVPEVLPAAAPGSCGVGTGSPAFPTLDCLQGFHVSSQHLNTQLEICRALLVEVDTEHAQRIGWRGGVRALPHAWHQFKVDGSAFEKRVCVRRVDGGRLEWIWKRFSAGFFFEGVDVQQRVNFLIHPVNARFCFFPVERLIVCTLLPSR
jgi:hypothetical protein